MTTFLEPFRRTVVSLEDKLKERWPNSQRLQEFFLELQKNPEEVNPTKFINGPGRTRNDPRCDCHTCDCEYCEEEGDCGFCHTARVLKTAYINLAKMERQEFEKAKQYEHAEN